MSDYERERLAQEFVTLYWPPQDLDNGTPAKFFEVQITAPEFGNSVRQGRNQTSQKTRAGYRVSYDRGQDLDNAFRWDFRNKSQSEKDELIAFLDRANWGATTMVARDWQGDEIVIRLTTNSINARNARAQVLNGRKEFNLWDFELNFVDLTNNTEEDLVRGDPSTAIGVFQQHAGDAFAHFPLTVTENLNAGAGTITIKEETDSTVVAAVFEGSFVSTNLPTERSMYFRAIAVVTPSAIASTDFEYVTNGAILGDVALSIIKAGPSQPIELQATISDNTYTSVVSVRGF